MDLICNSILKKWFQAREDDYIFTIYKKYDNIICINPNGFSNLISIYYPEVYTI